MFENLIDRLENSFKMLKGEGKITEINISETLKEVRRALLDADVSYKVAKSFCDDVKDSFEAVLSVEQLEKVENGQIKIVPKKSCSQFLTPNEM